MDAKLRHAILTALTAYDEKQSTKRNYNLFALPQYIQALDRVEAMVGEVPLRQALVTCFTGRLLDAVLKAVGEPVSTRDEQRI